MDGITGIIGPEGAGKTCLMTAYCCRDIRYGGKVYTFPGYEVTDKSGNPVSEVILPEQWVTLPDNLNGITIAITEANIFFNSLRFQESTSELFAYLSQQRRKRKMGIIYDVQDWHWFNNRLRDLTHVLISCWDLYWTYRGRPECPPKGRYIVTTAFDVKGFYTGRPWSKSRPRMFNASKYYPYFNTDKTVDPSEGKIVIDRKRRKVAVGEDGAVMAPAAVAIDEENIRQRLSHSLPRDVEGDIKQVLDVARGQGIAEMPAEELRALISTTGIQLHPKMLGMILRKLGITYRQRRAGNYYELS